MFSAEVCTFLGIFTLAYLFSVLIPHRLWRKTLVIVSYLSQVFGVGYMNGIILFWFM